MMRTGVVGTRGTCPYVATNATNVAPGSVLAAKLATGVAVATTLVMPTMAAAITSQGFSYSMAAPLPYQGPPSDVPLAEIGPWLGVVGAIAGSISGVKAFNAPGVSITNSFSFSTGAFAFASGFLAVGLGIIHSYGVALGLGICSSALASVSWGLFLLQENRASKRP